MKRLLKYFLVALVVITGVFAQTADAKAFHIHTLFPFQPEVREA